MNESTSSAPSARVIDALKSLRTLSSRTILFGAALLGIAAVGGAELKGL